MWSENMRALLVAVMSRVQSAALFFSLRHLVLRAFRMPVGTGSAIHRHVRFLSVGKFCVGDYSSIGRGCLIDNRVGVEIGSSVSIAHECSIYSLGHDINDDFFSPKGARVVIEDHVVLFARCMIMPGVRIGKGAVVYSGAVVSRDIAPWSVVAGVPARVIGTRRQDLDYKVSYKIWFGR